jgi:hypothetical protein
VGRSDPVWSHVAAQTPSSTKQARRQTGTADEVRIGDRSGQRSAKGRSNEKVLQTFGHLGREIAGLRPTMNTAVQCMAAVFARRRRTAMDRELPVAELLGADHSLVASSSAAASHALRFALRYMFVPMRSRDCGGGRRRPPDRTGRP